MKNKFLLLFCFVALATLAFVSCKKDCDHTFSDKWSSDSTSHWYAATCEHGELKESLASHNDADEDGKCDVCKYDVEHKHTFKNTWSYDDFEHWHDATCLHTTEKSSVSLHYDENLDNLCDACGSHVHKLDGAGFCHDCNKEVKPVVETDIGSVIYATTARTQNIVGGNIDYSQISRLKDKNPSIEHAVEFLLGTNGTYYRWTEDEVESIPLDEVEDESTIVDTYNDYASIKTGNLLVIEKWIEIIDAENVKGISATSVNGIYKGAEPVSYSIDDLAGYYYAVSALADGHGAEAVLSALYDAYLNYGIDKANIVHNEKNNTYDFSYKALVISTSETDIGTVHNANYYEVSISFAYTDNYELTTLDISCDCYTNDPGSDLRGKILEEEIDFDYDPATGAFTMRDNARADTYEISVSQTVGKRGEIDINDGSEFTPTDFDIYLEEELVNKAEDIELTVGQNDVSFYIASSPADAFFDFIKGSFDAKVIDSNGEDATSAIGVYLTGNVIYLIPMTPGEYTITISAINITKTVSATVTGTPLQGEHFINVTTTENNGWVDLVEFTAEATGEYTFYFPYGTGAWEKSSYDNNKGAPYVDPMDPENRKTSFTITLIKGQKLRFYFTAPVKGTTYTIGYDAP